MITLMTLTAATGMLLAVAASNTPSEASLRAADAAQMEAGARSDAAATGAIQHPNYLGNAPNNKVVDAETVRRMMTSGQIKSDSFARSIERIAITGNVGVVMGKEEIVGSTGSISQQDFGDRTLTRRFTNVYLFEDGRWLLLVRHANVTPAIK